MSQSFVRTASSVCQAQEENMSVNAAKSNFGKPEVEYLGHVLTKHEIKSQTKKDTRYLSLSDTASYG